MHSNQKCQSNFCLISLYVVHVWPLTDYSYQTYWFVSLHDKSGTTVGTASVGLGFVLPVPPVVCGNPGQS